MKKAKTNNDMVKALVKELDSNSLVMAILRERINVIMDMTMKDIEENPKDWENQIIHQNVYKELDRLVKKHIGFDFEQNIHNN